MTRNRYLLQVAIAFTLSLVITILLMSSAFAYGWAGTIQQDKPYRVDTFQLDEPGDLNVETSGGHIRVQGSESNTMRIEMYARKDGENLSPRDTDLEDWDISISQSGHSVRAIAKREGSTWSLWGGNNISISFIIYAPRQLSTNLRTSGGHIKAGSLAGNHKVKTSGGHLEFHDIDGEVEAKTSGGHVDLHNIQGNTDAKTSGGHINAEGITGDLSLKTSGGHISLADISGSIEAKTSGGNIQADLSSIESMVALRTSGGNVNITVPDQTGLDLNLRGSFVNARLSDFSGEIERDEIAGKLYGGGPELSARTSGGTVSLSFH